MIGIIVVRVLFTALAFYFGWQIGKFKALSEFIPCEVYAPVVQYVEVQADEASLLPCNEESGDIKIYDHCTESPYRTDKMFWHLAPMTIPEDIFPKLHHPSSPAKWAFVLSQGEKWPKKNAIQSECQHIYLTRTGSRSSQPNKCVAVVKVPEGVASIVQNSHRTGYTALLTNQYQNDYPRPEIIEEERELLPQLIRELPALLEEFKRKMGNPLLPDGTRRAAIIMVANNGVMDLALNFMCSAEAAGIDISSVMMFVGTKSDVELVENMGAQAMYSAALGSMPPLAAGFYMDKSFGRMMWFKTTSVYLALNAGFDVLFQDVDLVWMKDPIPYLRSIDADISFMDDGARTPRYSPFYVNSGFYYMKNSARTRYFQEKMMKAGASEIGVTHSHQSVLIRHIAESHHLANLVVNVLDQDMFPSGQAYHEKKKYLQTVIDRTFVPYVFHMCWTSNREDKVKYFKEIKLWYLPDDTPENKVCNAGVMMHDYASTSIRRSHSAGKGPSEGSDAIRNRCCQRDRYWKIK